MNNLRILKGAAYIGSRARWLFCSLAAARNAARMK